MAKNILSGIMKNQIDMSSAGKKKNEDPVNPITNIPKNPAEQLQKQANDLAAQRMSIGAPTITGSYSPDLQGFETATGQVYPTRNPKFIPNPAPSTKISVNPDRSVTFEKNGISFNLSPEEYRGLLGGTGGFVTPNVEAAGQLQEQKALTQEQQMAVETIGKETPVGAGQLSEEQQGLSIESNLGEATPGILAEGLSFAAGGAAGGAILGGVPGAVVGGVGGFLTGSIRATLSNLKQEASEDAINEEAEYKGSLKAIKLSIAAAHKRALSSDEAIKIYNRAIDDIRRNERNLKVLTDTETAEYLSDGRKKLTAIKKFLQEEKPIYDAKLRAAITNPNANYNDPSLIEEV